jgi:hypothetical protein
VAALRGLLAVLVSCCRGREEEEEGLHGVFKRLRRNGHQLEKGCCRTGLLDDDEVTLVCSGAYGATKTW